MCGREARGRGVSVWEGGERQRCECVGGRREREERGRGVSVWEGGKRNRNVICNV